MRKSNSTLMDGKKLQSHQQSQIMGLDPIQLLIKVYDFVIVQCKKGDMDKASKGLVELISSLNFEYAEVSLGLFRLYQYCMDLVRQSKFDEAIEILHSLRNSWIEATGANNGGTKVKI